jgi:hypothetical protein
MAGEGRRVITLPEPLRVLTPGQVSQIDRCLAELTAFGRLTLIKRDGRLRFIERTESLEPLPQKWEHPSPGS